MPLDVNASPLALDIGPAVASLDRLAAADAGLRGELLQTQKAAQVAFGQSADSLSEIVTESRAAAAAQRQFAGDIAGLVKEIRDQAAAQREAQRANAEAAAERRKANAEARAAAKAEKQAAKEAADAAKEVAAAEKLRAQAAAAANAETGKGGGFLSKLGNSLSSLQGQVAAAFSVVAIKEFFASVAETGQMAEATIGKLTFANGGNAQAAARDLAFIRAEADRLGLDLNGAGKSYGSFVAAASAGNFPLAEARKLFLATAGASATLKLSADDTQGVLLALTQILSKGTVAAEELRGQIGERLPGAFSIAARAMGVTEQQLNKLLSTGQIKSVDFLPKFAEELQRTFGDGTAQAFDAAIANQNRFENEYRAFLLRFQGLTAGATAKAADYFKRFNEGLDLKSIGGRTRLGEAAAQPGIQAYEAQLASLVKQAETQAKATGTDTAFQVGFVLAAQRNTLEKQRAEAQKALAFFDTTTKQGNVNAGNFAGGLQAFRQEEVVARERVALIEGELAKIDELRAARQKALAPAELEGLIKKQEDLIKSLKLRQKAATQENQGTGGDFLLGAGGLDEQIKSAEKELDRLLGKVDKTAKAAADKLAAALRALAEAQEQLRTKAAAASTKDADDAAVRAKLAFDEQLRQVDVIKQKLIEREAAVRKAGGRGANADGVIDGTQEKALAALRIAALDAYYDELRKITLAREQRLFDLRADSDAKQVEAVNRKYDRLIEAAKDGIEREALEEARAREQVALRQKQQQAAIDNTANVSAARAQLAGATFGAGTGISAIEARRAEKQALLEIDKKHAEDTLNNAQLLNGKEGELARAQASARVATAAQELAALEAEKRKHKVEDFFFKLILGDKDSDQARQDVSRALNEVTGTFINAFNEINAAQQQAAQQRVQDSTQRINELAAQLSAEIQLNREGSASNIKGLQDQIAEEKAVRRQALEDQRAAAKQKVIIDTITQASAIATTVADIFAATAYLNVAPGVGFAIASALSAAVIGAFVASKAAAFSAANSSGQGFFKGGFTGGNSDTEERGVVHGREFVHTAATTSKYRLSLFEPLHAGTPDKIDWKAPEMAALLPNLELPGQIRAEKAANVAHTLEISHKPLTAAMDKLHERLTAIEGSNQVIADKKDYIMLPDGKGFIEKGANGSERRVSWSG